MPSRVPSHLLPMSLFHWSSPQQYHFNLSLVRGTKGQREPKLDDGFAPGNGRRWSGANLGQVLDTNKYMELLSCAEQGSMEETVVALCKACSWCSSHSTIEPPWRQQSPSTTLQKNNHREVCTGEVKRSVVLKETNAKLSSLPSQPTCGPWSNISH